MNLIAEKLSSFYSFHSENSNLVEYFYLIVQTYKNYLTQDPEKHPKTFLDKKFIRDIYLEIFLLKLTLKQEIPALYNHILMIGSSIEDLFMFDCMTHFIDSFSLNFSLQIIDLMIFFGNTTPKASLIWMLLRINLIKMLLKLNKDVFLLATNSSELFAVKKNVFRFYEFSEQNVEQQNLLMEVVREYLQLEFNQQNKADKDTFEAEYEEDPFLAYKYVDLNCFKNYEALYMKMKNRLSADYTMFDFVYKKTSDVRFFFEMTKQLDWTFNRDDNLFKLIQKAKLKNTLRINQSFEVSEESEELSSLADDEEYLSVEEDEEEYEEEEEDQDHLIEESELNQFNKFAESQKDKNLAVSGIGLSQSGLVSSMIHKSKSILAKNNPEANESKESIDLETIGEVFKPHQIQFFTIKDHFLLKFKLLNLRFPGQLLEGLHFRDKEVEIQFFIDDSEIYSTIFDLKKIIFQRTEKIQERKLQIKPLFINIICFFYQYKFSHKLMLDAFYDNTFEKFEVCLVNEDAMSSQIFLEIALVIMSPDDDPYDQFVVSDAGYVFCNDRIIESDLVLKRPQVLEFNSLKKLKDLNEEMEPILKKMGKSFRKDYQNVMSKYFGNEEFVILIKIFLFYAFNSEDLELSDEKLELIWEILTFFEKNENQISLKTFNFFFENLISNFFPFLNVTISQRMAERIMGKSNYKLVTLRILSNVLQ